MKKWVQILLHVVVWFILLVLPFLIPGASEHYRGNKHFMVNWISGVFFNMLIFYFYYLYFNPKFLRRRSLLFYFLATLVIIFGYSVFRQTVVSMGLARVFQLDYNETLNWGGVIVGGTITNGFFVAVSMFLSFTAFWFKNHQKQSEIQRQKLQSELHMLKYQINPHFLFNTLNNIYTLVYKKSEKAPEAVLKLSNIMRYMIYETNTEYVDLKKELDYLHYFIDLQKLRLKDVSGIQYRVIGNPEGKKIIPMLIIPFVENAFKHSAASESNPQIDIRIKIEERNLQFEIRNNTGRRKVISNSHSGIGLENVKKRLELMYPQQHKLKIMNEKDSFTVDLHIFDVRTI